MQREDFEGIFRAMGERPVTIRTLDPPLHEFLPHTDAEQQRGGARRWASRPTSIAAKVEDLHEANPMLGHRGCRLGIAYPEITRMQARAILEAACIVKKEGVDVHPEIMIPLVGTKKELEDQAAQSCARVAEEVFAEQGVTRRLPGRHDDRDPARRADGRRDRRGGRVLQLRHQRPDADDASASRATTPASSCRSTSSSEIWPADPFQTLDQTGVGQLVEMGIERGRATRPDLKVGICGEHGGDPEIGQVLPPRRA